MFSNPKAETGTRVIVLRGEWLDEKDLNLALKGISERAWTALVQLVEMERLDSMDATQDCAVTNNALLMSFNNGGPHALAKFLENVDNRRKLPST